VVSKVDPFLQAQIDRNGIAFGESKSTYFSGVEDYKLVMTEAEVDMAVQKVFINSSSNFLFTCEDFVSAWPDGFLLASI